MATLLEKKQEHRWIRSLSQASCQEDLCRAGAGTDKRLICRVQMHHSGTTGHHTELKQTAADTSLKTALIISPGEVRFACEVAKIGSFECP